MPASDKSVGSAHAAMPGRSPRQLDLTHFERLLSALRRPYEENVEVARYAEPAPAQIWQECHSG